MWQWLVVNENASKQYTSKQFSNKLFFFSPVKDFHLSNKNKTKDFSIHSYIIIYPVQEESVVSSQAMASSFHIKVYFIWEKNLGHDMKRVCNVGTDIGMQKGKIHGYDVQGA